jgi:hypothetical protein
MFGEVLVRRWSNTLGHAMWEFAAGVAGHRRCLIIAHAKPGRTAARGALAEDYDLARDHREHLIAIGPLMSGERPPSTHLPQVTTSAGSL